MATSLPEGSMPERKTFKSDYRLIWLSSLGLLGIFLTNLLFFRISTGDDCSPKRPVFHEITYTPKNIVEAMIDSRLPEMEERLKILGDSLNLLAEQAAAGGQALKLKAALQQKIKEDSLYYSKHKAYSKYWTGVSFTDTIAFNALNKALHFKIDQDLLNRWDCSGEDSIAIETAFIDLALPARIDTTVMLRLTPVNRNIDFITRYPGFGSWLLLIFIFTGFCLIAISTCLYLTRKRVELFVENRISGHNERDYYWATVLLVILLVLLSLLWKWTFYDGEVVRDIYFMKTLSFKLKWIFYLGILAGAFCLAGFIHSGVLLGYFAREIRKARKSIRQMQQSGTTEDQVSDNGQSLELQRAIDENKRDRIIYEGLGKTFHAFFILSAIILSLTVLCTGALYSAVNSLDFIKLVADDWGYSPVRSEFVYMYGALYTIILLIIYVPAHMRLAEITLPDEPAEKPTGRWWDLSKTLFGDLKSILIAASPLLASLAQALINFLFA